MAKIGVGGVDLYCLAGKTWEYVNSGVPYGKRNESTLISGMDTTYKEFMIYLPLYDGVDTLEIGISDGSWISRRENNGSAGIKSVVFYGTSITQVDAPRDRAWPIQQSFPDGWVLRFSISASAETAGWNNR